MDTCFVVMGFGIKTDYQSGRKLDLDKSYLNLIKPAVEAAGLKCIRADEIVHAGIIDVPMYEQLLMAEVVVADVSTMNPNAFYELGVRHALRPYTTIIVAESELKFPFDVGHIVIQQYRHLGEDIGVSEATRFKALLTKAVLEILARPKEDRRDSPVYTFLRLNPPSQILEAIENATAKPADEGAKNETTLRTLLDQIDTARKGGQWPVVKFLLEQVRDHMQKKAAPGITNVAVDPYILQQLALATYKSDGSEAGLRQARAVLQALQPETSNDPETLGLWGAIHKRLWEKTKDTKALDESIDAHERGFYLRNDYYNGINCAFLLDVRASVTKGDEAAADRVVANRLRYKLLHFCEKQLLEPEIRPAERYWILASMAEAHYGLGHKDEYESFMGKARAIAPETWMVPSTLEQIDKLAKVLRQPGQSYSTADAGGKS